MIIQTFLAFFTLLVRNMDKIRFGIYALRQFNEGSNCPTFSTIIDFDEENNILHLSLIFDDAHWILLEISLVSCLILEGNDDSNSEPAYYVKHFDIVGGCNCGACQSCLVKLADEGGNWYSSGDLLRNRQDLSSILQEISAQWHEDQLELEQVKASNFTNSSGNYSEGIPFKDGSSKSTHNPLPKDRATTIFAAGGGPPYCVGNYAEE